VCAQGYPKWNEEKRRFYVRVGLEKACGKITKMHVALSGEPGERTFVAHEAYDGMNKGLRSREERDLGEALRSACEDIVEAEADKLTARLSEAMDRDGQPAESFPLSSTLCADLLQAGAASRLGPCLLWPPATPRFGRLTAD